MNRTLGLSLISVSAAAMLAVPMPAPAAAARTSLVGQRAYHCQMSSPGLGTGDYGVTMRMQISAPASVQPGQSLSLTGVLTLQFDETLYQNAHTLGITSIDGYSSTMTMTTATNAGSSTLTAYRWQTSPMALSDPIVITAPISFPAFTVPKTASGSVQLGTPRNGTTANTVSSSPGTVAFSGVAQAKGALGSYNFNLACYLTDGPAATLGAIPIVSAVSTATPAGTPGRSATGATGGNATQPMAGGAPPAGSVAANTPAAVGSTTGGSDSSNAGALAPNTASALGSQGQAPDVSPMMAPVADSTRSGVFVSTTTLVLLGLIVCCGALAYAALARHRLRMIQRAMDD